MKSYDILKEIAGTSLAINVAQNINAEDFFDGRYFIDKGSDYKNAAWGSKIDLPFEFVWLWEPKSVIPTHVLESADIVLTPKCLLSNRIVIFEITKY